jgi:hypothetical protein
LQRAAAADFPRATPLLRAGWRETEAWIEAERVPLENAAHLEAAAGRRDRAAELVSDFMDRVVDAVLQRAEALLAEIG